MRGSKLPTLAWLAGLAVANLVLLVLVVQYSIGTIRGQMLDTVALAGNGLGRARFGGTLNTALDAVSVASVVLVLIAVGLIAVARRRFALAVMAVLLVAGSVATTYVLKAYVITRTDLGVDPDRAGAGNSLPSGHATAAAAFAVGLVLVLPKAARGIASLVGATYAAVVGVATLSAGWHRPSDVIASYLLVGGWAAAAGLLLVASQRQDAPASDRERAGWSLAGTLTAGGVLLVAGLVALALTFERMSTPIADMSPRLLTLGYAGSVAAIAGAAYLMMAVVLVTVHQVVPANGDAHPGSGPPSLLAASARGG